MSAVSELAEKTKVELIERGTRTHDMGQPEGPVCFLGAVSAATGRNPEAGWDIFHPSGGDYDETAYALAATASEVIDPKNPTAWPASRLMRWFDSVIKGDLDQALAVLDAVIEKESSQ